MHPVKRWLPTLCLFLTLIISSACTIDMYDPLGEDDVAFERLKLSGSIDLENIPPQTNLKVYFNHNMVGFLPNGQKFIRSLSGYVQAPFMVSVASFDGNLLFKAWVPSYFGMVISENNMVDLWLTQKCASESMLLEICQAWVKQFSYKPLYQHLMGELKKTPLLTPKKWVFPTAITQYIKENTKLIKNLPKKYPSKLTFNSHIFPIIQAKCISCHKPELQKRTGSLSKDLAKKSDFDASAELVQKAVCFEKSMPPADSSFIMTDMERSLFHDYIESRKEQKTINSSW